MMVTHRVAIFCTLKAFVGDRNACQPPKTKLTVTEQVKWPRRLDFWLEWFIVSAAGEAQQTAAGGADFRRWLHGSQQLVHFSAS